MTRGVLLIALGHEHYKSMSHVLAASIRTNDPGLSITLATDKQIHERYKPLYDKVKIISEKLYVIKDRKQYLRTKLCIVDLSPYDETLFLDVDQVLLPKKQISPLFDLLAGQEFTMSNTGLAGSSVWVDMKEAKKLYGNKPFWNFHSELIYFKKTDKVKAYFKKAKEIYDDPQLKTAFKFAGGNMADELAFQIASMITGIYPHQENWTPNFWYVRHPGMNAKYPYQLDEFITYSIGGAAVPPHVKKNYNTLAAYFFSKQKLQNPYKVKDKRSFLLERSKI